MLAVGTHEHSWLQTVMGITCEDESSASIALKDKSVSSVAPHITDVQYL